MLYDIAFFHKCIMNLYFQNLEDPNVFEVFGLNFQKNRDFPDNFLIFMHEQSKINESITINTLYSYKFVVSFKSRIFGQ